MSIRMSGLLGGIALAAALFGSAQAAPLSPATVSGVTGQADAGWVQTVRHSHWHKKSWHKKKRHHHHHHRRHH